MKAPPLTLICCPGDVIAVGDQEDHRLGDLLRLGEAAQRDLGLDLGLDVGRHLGEHVGLGVARRDAVHRDARLRQLQRGRPGEGDDAALAGAVVGLADAPDLAVHRADVDDAPVALRGHDRDGGRRAEEARR